MATYRITDPTTGRKLKLTGDSPPSEQELNEIFSNLGPAKENPSLLKRGYAALAVPEKMSREGLGQLAQMVPSAEPTGNTVRDLALNVPKVLAESVAEVAPSFISRGAMITGGALKGIKAARPALSAMRKGALGILEKTSGIAPRQAGALEAAYKDPSLIFAKGKEAAGKFYEAAKNPEANIFEGITKNTKIVDKAQAVLKEGGKLEPIEALTARKAVDNLISKKDTVKDVLFPLRSKLDAIAKADANIAKGDEIVSRGVKAAAIRTPFPTNIGGTFSIARSLGGGLASQVIPGGNVIAPLAMVPAVQGAGATALGVASKLATPVINNATKVAPVAAAAFKVLTEDVAKKFLRKAKGDKDKARTMALEAGYEIPE